LKLVKNSLIIALPYILYVRKSKKLL